MNREDELDALSRARLERDRVRHGLGWNGQELPRGMRPGAERPSYFWDTGKGLEVEMVYVPASGGERAFFVGRFPTTWREYRIFCADAAHPSPPDPGAFPPFDDHPVVNVAWSDASAFCAWAGLRLPYAREWDRAAFGDDGRRFPWGNELPTDEHCPVAARSTAPVTSCARGASPSGALHMVGNVWQWTATPGNSEGTRIIRGGSWDNSLDEALVPSALEVPTRVNIVGFRPLRPT